MNTLLSTLTIVILAVCGPETATVGEDLTIKKNTNSPKQESIIYKKVPTKWVKITKKSN